MRLADRRAPAGPGGGGEGPRGGRGGPRGAGGGGGGEPPMPGGSRGVVPPGQQSPPGEDRVFRDAVAAFESGRDAVCEVRDDIAFEDCPAPKRLAPFAAAVAATAYRDGVEAGTGRLVLLYDPDGQQGWTGTFR